jgi:2-C-methyl-D-erythritol 2,4-cyclodiphosphate synthase
MALLAEVAARVTGAGWRVRNVDVAVVLEAPKLAPRRAELEANLGAAAGGPVTVKAKRAEGLGALGRREGIACFAVGLLDRP